MTNYTPKHGDMEMWMICTAIGSNHDLISKMKKNPDGSYPVKFEVGGIELDFSEVANSLDKQIADMVKERAESLLNERYNPLLGEIYDIQERLENQKNELFKYDWEQNNNLEIEDLR